jgi:hypothetical protein
MPEPYVPPVPETVLPWFDMEGSEARHSVIGKWNVEANKRVNQIAIRRYDGATCELMCEDEIRTLAVELNKAFKIGWARHEYPKEEPPLGTAFIKSYLVQYQSGDWQKLMWGSRCHWMHVVAWYELPEEVK